MHQVIYDSILTVGDTDQLTDNRSGEIRWQAERRAAMETAVLYFNEKQKSIPLSKQSCAEPSSIMDDSSPSDEATASVDVVNKAQNSVPVQGNIVWAGLEPIEFVALFPDWIERKDIRQINVQVN